jgi:hypothetical protein
MLAFVIAIGEEIALENAEDMFFWPLVRGWVPISMGKGRKLIKREVLLRANQLLAFSNRSKG